jgi:hypothetical protein
MEQRPHAVHHEAAWVIRHALAALIMMPAF